MFAVSALADGWTESQSPVDVLETTAPLSWRRRSRKEPSLLSGFVPLLLSRLIFEIRSDTTAQACLELTAYPTLASGSWQSSHSPEIKA